MITLKPSLEPNHNQKAMIRRRYGMFIHFGINTFNDTEWSDGSLPLSSYNPTEIDAEGWIKNAKAAGMTYVIIITKHHDGFCLFDTKYTEYAVKNTFVPTDVVLEVAKACKKYGLKLGMYYSLWDRHEPCYKRDEQYVTFMCNQLTELLGGKYGEVCELWLDGDWDKKEEKWNIPKLYDLVHTLQPSCCMAVNHTIGKSGFVLNKKKYDPKNYKEGMPIHYFPSDFRLSDPYFPDNGDPKLYMHGNMYYYLPFEATICIRNMCNWFWDTKYTSEKLVPTDFIVEKYRQTERQSNCLVINVAPNTAGRQEQSDVDRLFDVAKVLRIGKYATR